MENTYYSNTTSAAGDYQVVHQKLFGRDFTFTRSIDDADIIVIPNNTIETQRKDVAYIFLRKPLSHEDTTVTGGYETFKDDKGSEVYVIYSNNLFISEQIVVFLNGKGFYSSEEGDVEVIPHISDLLEIHENSFLYNLLISITPLVQSSDGENRVSFEEFLIFILSEIIGESNSNEVAKRLVIAYRAEFYVSFTTRDFALDNVSNMERREFIGDRVAWSTMTTYFINRFTSNSDNEDDSAVTNRNGLNQNEMTCLHRDYCSKQIQASISYSLFFHLFVRTNSRKTMNTYEDLFEAFVGTLYEISFRERINGIYTDTLNLHELFLTKLYNSFEIVPTDDKPPITEFSEMMVSLSTVNTGDTLNISERATLYKIKREKNQISLWLSPRLSSVILEKLGNPNTVADLTRVLRSRRRYNELNKISECNEYFRQLIAQIRSIVGEDTLNDLQNLKSIAQEQLDTLKTLLPNTRFTCHLGTSRGTGQIHTGNSR